MNKLFHKLLFILGFAAVAPLALAAGDPARGEQQVAVCAACHGDDGNSPATNFPNLAGLGHKYLFKQLQDIKSGERVVPEMTGMLDNASDRDLADMAAFYASKTMRLSGAQRMLVRLNSGEEVDALALGERVYRAGNAESKTPACSGCHSPRGLGNDPTLYPRLGGQHAAYIEKQLRDFRAGNRLNDGDSQVMRRVAQYLSDAEIIALSHYIAGLH